MYDPYEEFDQNNEPLSAEINLKLQRDAVQAEQAIMQTQAAEEAVKQQEAGTPATQNSNQPQPQQQSTKENTDPPDLGDRARDVLEGATAPIVGVSDFGVDLLNKIPGVDLPKVPKYKNELLQAARELASIVVPTILLTKAGGQAGAAANARVGWKLGQNALVKWISNAGLAAGAGAFVDATNKLNETDDNVQGTLKKMFPKQFSWISDDWATLDSDSPDVKRAKNVNEGVGLGIFSDFLTGVGKLLRASKSTQLFSRTLIPEDELAKVKFSKLQKPEMSVEEAVFDSAGRREIDTDELGKYRMSKVANLDDPMNLDQPIFGISSNDVFDLEEQGIRSVDSDGVIGASVDQAQISKNVGTVWGRIGSIVTESALKNGLKADNITKRTLIKGIVEEIKTSGKYGARVGTQLLTFDDIDKAGTDLAQYMMDPRMDAGMLKGTLDNFMQTTSGIKNLDDIGYNAAMKAVKGYMDEYLNMDTLKAQAYLTTSLAGQVSDIAEGSRYMEGTSAIERAQEQILDRLEFLLIEKGLAAQLRGRALNYLNTWQRIGTRNPKKLSELANAAKQETDAIFATEIVAKQKAYIDKLREFSKERPEFLKSFMWANEMTDGRIDTMAKLNNFVDQSLSDVGKAFVDQQPDIPNVIVQGMWSNIYNSVLTSISTPMKAAFGNTVLLLEKPITVLGGALMGGDLKTLKRGWYTYSGFFDTFRKGLEHMNLVYRKAAIDPTSVSYITRDDIAIKNENTMRVLKEFSDAAASRGEYGPSVLYQKAEMLHDISMHPWLRFGANAMTALDGFARAVIANGEARAKVYDKFIDGGRKLNADGIRKALDEQYSMMFDGNGMITDKAVEYASREVAMNLDNPAVDAISQFIKRYPAIKPFMMFPTTSANMISMANKHSPWSLFAKDYNDLAFRQFNSFTADEISDILTVRGLPVTEEAFRTLQAEVRGRKAIGTMTVAVASGLFLNDSLRGNGHYDKERQKTRQELGWKPRTYRGWDGRWYSYDGLGPISDWLALTADVMDNFDSITEADLEQNLNKMGFILSANLTNKSMLAGVEPLNDVLAGNPAALARWGASFGSSLAPLSGFRNELGRVLAPQLREVDMEFIQLLRNRNRFTDVIDPKTALPDAHDWIDGKKIGYNENFFARLWNATMPIKVHDDISPERQFLIDIEYDARPSFNKSTKSVEYTPAERSELASIMGKTGYLKSEIRRIMNSTDAKAWRESIKTERGKGSRVDPEQWLNIYSQLNVALYNAKRLAESQMSNRREIMARQYDQSRDKIMQRKGVAVLNWQNK